VPVQMTETAIRAAIKKVATIGRMDISDAVEAGLRLRLTASGGRSWVLACRDPLGRMRRFPLGEYGDAPKMGIADARKAAQAMRVKVRDGADPVADAKRDRQIGRDAREGIGTLAALLDLYEAKGKPGSKLKSWKAQRQSIQHVFSKHLTRPLAMMTAASLQTTAHAHAAEYSAALAVRALRPVLKWAAQINVAPTALADIRPPASVQRRKRVLSADELRVLLPALATSDRPYAAAMRFMLLTLARREEVGSASWARVDLDARTWTIPETKNGEAHIVPLSRQAALLLRARLPVNGAGNAVKPNEPATLIFATATGHALGNWDREAKRLLLDSGLATVLDTTQAKKGRKKIDVVMKDGSVLPTRHDLRRTAATILGDMGELPDVIEAALNHVSIRSALAATYNRSRYRPQVAAALQRLADALDGIEMGSAKVMPLRAGS
jgi:integrase